MNQQEYITQLFVKEDPLLQKVLQSIVEHNMPEISIQPDGGKLLTMLVKMSGAKNILEIGALGGYSGICLMRGAGSGSQLTSLELEQKHVDVAYQNMKHAGFEQRVKYMIGDAKHSLQSLIKNDETFDFFFIDADKGNYVNYLEWCIQLANPGAIITADNTLRKGTVYDATVTDKDTDAIRQYNQIAAEHPQLESLLIPSGDGLTVSVVQK